MFDLITGDVTHAPRPHAAPVVASIVAHAVVALALLGATVFMVSSDLPEVRTMMAFVAAPPMEPPPPPPPVAVKAVEQAERPKPKPAATVPVPIDVPIALEFDPTAPGHDEEDVAGGVEGGVPGGIAGGVEADAVALPPPPSPPPPPPVPTAPIRVGGRVKEPALLYRVEPVYPRMAASAGVEGSVILEAVVGRDGQVETVRVLRSQGVLDQPALDAVKQWRYSPVLLNGRPERFILTVVVTFKLEQR
jgi:protein TonB